MNHKFKSIKSPKHKIKVFRCKQCAIKVAQIAPFLTQSCNPTNTSKRENDYYARGVIFGSGGVKHLNLK